MIVFIKCVQLGGGEKLQELHILFCIKDTQKRPEERVGGGGGTGQRSRYRKESHTV